MQRFVRVGNWALAEDVATPEEEASVEDDNLTILVEIDLTSMSQERSVLFATRRDVTALTTPAKTGRERSTT